jgi:hypothetical protein
MPTGHYTEIRLVVSSAALYFDNASTGSPCASMIAAPRGRRAAVDVPSGELRLNREFDVTSTAPTTILLDFDGDQSVKQTGNGIDGEGARDLGKAIVDEATLTGWLAGRSRGAEASV